jgi:hypothetical protein
MGAGRAYYFRSRNKSCLVLNFFMFILNLKNYERFQNPPDTFVNFLANFSKN